MKIVAIILGIVTVGIILGAMWVWALFGMSEDVAFAWCITGLITGGGAMMSLVFINDTAKSKKEK